MDENMRKSLLDVLERHLVCQAIGP